MVFFISNEDMVEVRKKLAAASQSVDETMPYIIFNGTDDPKIKDLTTGSCVMEELQAKKSLCKKGLIDDDTRERGIKKYLKQKKMLQAMGSVVAAFVSETHNDNPDIPIMVVLQDRTYKALVDDIIKRWKKVTEIEDLFIDWRDTKTMEKYLKNDMDELTKKYRKKIEKLHDSDLTRNEKMKEEAKLQSKIDVIEEEYGGTDSSSKKKIALAYVKKHRTTSKMVKQAKRFLDENKKFFAAD